MVVGSWDLRCIKILYLITDLDVGGAEKQLALLAPRLDRRSFEVRVVCLKPEGPVAARIRAEGIPVESLGWRHLPDPRPLVRLEGILRGFRPRILHTFLVHADLVGRLLGRFAKTPGILTSVRVTAETDRPWRAPLLRLTAGFVDGATFVSGPVADFARRRLRLGDVPSAVIPNSVEPAVSAPSRRGPGPFRMLTAGRLTVQKGMDDVIVAMGLMDDDSSQLVIAGEGPRLGYLELVALASVVEDRVLFAGRCGSLDPWWRESDVFILNSLFEGMPNVVLEAMAHGVPVVVSESASAGIVKDGETGWIVRNGVGDLDRVLRAVRDRPDEAFRRAERALAWVREHHRVETMVERHEAFYRRIASGRTQ